MSFTPEPGQRYPLSIRSMPIHKRLGQHPLYFGLILSPLCLCISNWMPGANTFLFFLSLCAIVPLAALLSHATEKIAERLGNAAGGLLNATMGNMAELIICLTALHAGLFDLVKAAIAGAVIANAMFTLGISFLVGGFHHHMLKLNMDYVHMQAGLLLLATIALLVPSVLHALPGPQTAFSMQTLSLALSVVLVLVYLLSLIFTLFTHPEIFNRHERASPRKTDGWPLYGHVILMVVATLLIAWVSHIFVDTLSTTARDFPFSQVFIGFILVALAGGAAEMYSAAHAARQNRPELSVAIALGSSTQISLFVAPILVMLSYFIAPAPMSLNFSPGAVLMVLLSTFGIATIVSGRHATWYTGVLLLSIYAVFAVTLLLVPLNAQVM